MSNKGRGGRRSLPYAFTEPGVAMLSSVLNSERAVQMNILIVRAFIRMREIIAHNKDIAARMEKLERHRDETGSAIERLAREVQGIKAIPRPLATKRRIGFGPWDDD